MNKPALLMIAALIWCALVGKFAASVVWQAVNHQKIQVRSQEIPASIISSRILQKDGRSGRIYTPQINYKYNVKGKSYSSKQYSYGMGFTSNYKLVREIAEAYPPGQTIKVFYDPLDPARAAIDLQMPTRLYFLMLFTQPFLAVGVLGFFISLGLFITQIRKRTFLSQDMSSGCYIPGWGLLQNEMGGFVIGRDPNLAGPAKALLAGYGLGCFVSIFALGLQFREHGFTGQATSIKAAFAFSAMIGLATGFVRFLTQTKPARLYLDTALGKLSLDGPGREVKLNFKEIASWTLEQVPNPRPVKSETDMPNAPLVGVHTVYGKDIPIHIFSANADGFKIANKTGQGLARLTRKPFSRTVRPPETAPQPIDLGQARELAIEQTRKARRLWDLT